MDKKFKGIVIKAVDYKESDKLLTIFSLEFGKLTALIKSVKAPKAKLKFAKELFCFSEFVTAGRGEFNTVTSAEMIDSFHGIAENIDAYLEGCMVLEIVDKITAGGEPNPALFLRVLKALKMLAYEKTQNMIVVCKLLVDLFENLGYKFNVSACPTCRQKFMVAKFLNLDSGEVVCKNCRTGNSIEFTERAFSALRILADTEFEKLHSLKFSEGSGAELLEILKRNFKERLGVNLKTV